MRTTKTTDAALASLSTHGNGAAVESAAIARTSASCPAPADEHRRSVASALQGARTDTSTVAASTMRLSFLLQPCIDGHAVDASLLQLLDAIVEHGSVAAAARASGVSYRFAWDRLRYAESRYGHALVKMERGRGSRLTALALKLQETRRHADLATAPLLEQIASRFAHAQGAANRDGFARLRLAASHDLALIELKEYCARARPRLQIDLQVRGSMEAMAELARGRCDLAGFHISPDVKADISHLCPLSARTHRCILVGERSQGLMLASGNPKRVSTIADLARLGLRFVNRQSGSGTRALFDRLLDQSGHSQCQVHGYGTEEFTHMAVAAAVASGQADAGFGIHAAAAAHGLHFVPLRFETYYLAGRKDRIDTTPVRALLTLMRSAELQASVSRLAGYRMDACGSIVDLHDALAQRTPTPKARPGPVCASSTTQRIEP